MGVLPSPAADRLGRLAVPAILLLAFALRVTYVLQSRASPYFEAPQMDALYHWDWARAFAAGREFQPGPFFRAPLYPWFLGLLVRLFGEDLLLVRLVQAAIGTASVGLVHLVAREAFDRRTGWLAALLAAGYWVLIYFEGELLLPVLEVFLDLLALWLTLRAARRPGRAGWAVAGAAWGLAALVRPNVLLLAPCLIGWSLWRERGPGAWRSALLLLAGLAAPVFPVTAYNAFAGGELVLISTQGGATFWIGNNPRSDGASAIVPGTRPDWWGGFHDSIALAEAEAGRRLEPGEVSRHYARKAWAWMREEPGRALAHQLWKLRLFLTDWEIGNNTSEGFFALRFGPVLRSLPLGFGVLAPFALLGLLLSARRARSIFPLWCFLPVYAASVVAFFVCSRYRVPVLPVMAILAAHAAWWCVDALRARRLAPLALAAAFLLASGIFVRSVPASIDRSDSKGLWELGVLAQRAGDLEQAIGYYRASIERNPRWSVVHQDLGLALRAAGHAGEAERSLREAVERDPANVAALSGLADLLLFAGRADEARDAAQAALRASPVFAPAWYDLGRAILAAATPGDPAAAQEALARFAEGERLARDPVTAFNCALAAGRLLQALGRHVPAVEAFGRALAARPEPDAEGWWWECQRGLLASLRGAGRVDEARARAQALLRSHPADPRARALAQEHR